MALLGSEPVSAANLAGALGIETGGGSLPSDFGDRPVSVDNLKAILDSAGGILKADSHLLFLTERNPVYSGEMWAPVENYSQTVILFAADPSQCEPQVYDNSHGPVDEPDISVEGTSFTRIGGGGWNVYAIIGKK